MDGSGPHRRVVIAADDPDRARSVATVVDEQGLIPEVFERDDAINVEVPIRAAVLSISRPPGWEPIVRSYAAQALQPLTMIVLSSRPGAADIEYQTRAFGYRRILHRVTARPPGTRPRDDNSIRAAIVEFCRRDASLVPLIAKRLGNIDPETAHILAAAFEDPPVRTVARWFEHSRTGSPIVARRRIQKLGLGRPSAVLTDLRLLQAVYLSRTTQLTMDSIAEAVGYAHGDYLGRLAKARTGRAFRQLELGSALSLLLDV